MNLKNFILILIAAALLTSCKPSPSKLPTGCDQIESTLTKSIAEDNKIANPYHKKYRYAYSVKNALLPPLAVKIPNTPAQPAERTFDVAVQDMPARDFFMGLVWQSNMMKVASKH